MTDTPTNHKPLTFTVDYPQFCTSEFCSLTEEDNVRQVKITWKYDFAAMLEGLLKEGQEILDKSRELTSVHFGVLHFIEAVDFFTETGEEVQPSYHRVLRCELEFSQAPVRYTYLTLRTESKWTMEDFLEVQMTIGQDGKLF